jgi:drug/metabolite transporter (DMT)-like permease
MNNPIFLFLFAVCVFVSACSQVLLKKASSKDYKGIKKYLNMLTISGYSIFFTVSVCAVLLYKKIDLSVGAMIDSMNYVFIPLLGVVFFKEKLTKHSILGILLILSGIAVYVAFGL